MHPSFSKGRFLELFNADPADISRKIARLADFPALEHVEVLLEHVDQTPETTRLLREALKPYRIIVHAPFTNVGLVGRRETNQASVAILQSSYEWALSLGAEVFTVHAGGYPWYQSGEATADLFRAFIAQLRVAPGLRVAVENMPRAANPTAKNFLDSLIALESNVGPIPYLGYTFDIGHVIQNQESDWQVWFHRNQSRIYNIHFHDAFLGGKGHLALGTADLGAGEFVQFLIDAGYEQFLTLEVVGETEIELSWRSFLENI